MAIPIDTAKLEKIIAKQSQEIRKLSAKALFLERENSRRKQEIQQLINSSRKQLHKTKTKWQ